MEDGNSIRGTTQMHPLHCSEFLLLEMINSQNIDLRGDCVTVSHPRDKTNHRMFESKLQGKLLLVIAANHG